MPIPDTPRVVFRKNPLAEVICQLRFPTILSIATDLPAEFQDNIRDTYQLYQKDEGVTFPKEIADLVRRFQVNIPGETIVHRFLTADGDKTISLAQGFVAIAVRRYQRWEGFKIEIERVVSVLEKIYKPAFYSRTGLRYQNIIDRNLLNMGSSGWETLISPPFSGLLASDAVRDEISEAHSEVLLRLTEVKGGLAKLVYGLASQPQQDSSSQVFAFDVDLFTQERCTREESFDALGIFHQLAGNLFRWAITHELEQALDPQPRD